MSDHRVAHDLTDALRLHTGPAVQLSVLKAQRVEAIARVDWIGSEVASTTLLQRVPAAASRGVTNIVDDAHIAAAPSTLPQRPDPATAVTS